MFDAIIKKINNKSPDKILFYILVIIPFLFLFLIIRDCKIDVPFGDQWDLIPLLEKSYQGNVSISDLTVQHNEHRPLFPRLIWIYLARATDWNIGHELMVNFLLGFFIFITLSFQIRSTNKSINSPLIKWMIPVVALIVFSLNQWENWLWGWQISLFLSAFSVILGIVLLSGSIFKWSKFILALLMGIIAVYSFANGVVFWIIGIGILFVIDSFKNKKQKVLSIIIWVSSATIVMIIYLYNYQVPENHPSFFSFLLKPLQLTQYFFTFLGSPLAESGQAFIFGFLGVVFFILLTILLLKSKTKPNIILPYISMASYAIISAFISGIGRIHYGYLQAMSPRYTTFSNFFWFAFLMMVFLYINQQTEKNFFLELRIDLLPYFVLIIFLILSSNLPGIFFSYFSDLILIVIFVLLLFKTFNQFQQKKLLNKETLVKSLCFVGIFLVIPLIISRSFHGAQRSIERKKELKPIKEELIKLENEMLLKILYPPDPAKIKKLVPILKKRKLSLFRNP
jgi:hypothetical protein